MCSEDREPIRGESIPDDIAVAGGGSGGARAEEEGGGGGGGWGLPLIDDLEEEWLPLLPRGKPGKGLSLADVDREPQRGLFLVAADLSLPSELSLRGFIIV